MRTPPALTGERHVLWPVAASSVVGLVVLYVAAVGTAVGQLVDTRLRLAAAAGMPHRFSREAP